ncbi:intercellular adhesion molecule 1-like [Ambystoma mexicanum]|uniref:intercellular adhesion molecule 1-like n=1 Tax=Ambystoma mexicanum TaxID=8296 RepID=UPI0037E80AE1
MARTWLSFLLLVLAATGAESAGEPCEVAILGPNPQYVEWNGPVSLNCTKSCNTTGKLMWETHLRKDEKEEEAWTSMSSTMTVWETTPTCALVVQGAIYQAQTTLIAYQIPDDVTIGLLPPMKEGQSYNVTCDVRNIAPKRNLTVLIRRGNKTLHTQSYPSDSTEGLASAAVTYSVTAQREDHGAVYTCVAQLDMRPNGALFGKSHNISVRTYALSEPKINIAGAIQQGSVVTARCDVAKAFPPEEVKIEIMFGGQPLNITRRWHHETLTAEAVFPTTEPAWDMLECEAILYDDNQQAKEEVLIYRFTEPVIHIDAELSVDEDLNITCWVPETSPQEILLRVELEPNLTLKQCVGDSPHSCTHFLHAQKKYNGLLITCVATLKATNKTKRVSSVLNITYPPGFSESLCPSSQNLAVGDAITCEADGNPSPSVKCLNTGSMIEWQSTRRNQPAPVLCTATNPLGNRTQEVVVTVEYAPNITLLINAPETIQKGHNLTLHCLADGQPAPEYRWDTPVGATLIFSSDNSTITIQSATTRDAGTYICRARNRHGQDIAQREITVSDTLPLILGLALGISGAVVSVAAGVVYYLYNRAKKIQKYELQQSKQSAKQSANSESLLPPENKVLPFDVHG